MKIIGLVLKNRYQILEKIHENERFFSFAGIDTKDNSKVFIKVVRQSIIADKKKVKFFTEEVKSLAKIKHPNVVKVLDVDFKDGILYVVCEFVEGKSLYKYIDEKHKFDFWQVIQIVKQLAEILKFGFESGIKYRSVKHSNILITDSMQVKILSFNVPRSMLSNIPIPLSENRGIDPDIFFLGLVLFELFTLKFPLKEKEMPITDFDIIQDNILETRWQLSFNDIEEPESKSGIEKIIYHAVTRNILDRYKTIDEMMDDLKKFSQERSRNEEKTDVANSLAQELKTNDAVFQRRFENTQKSPVVNIPEDDTFNKKSIFLFGMYGLIIAVLLYFIYILLF
ncbi:MAG: serine/threonine-protein kinase [Candidatus Muiribacteriota bacterium]